MTPLPEEPTPSEGISDEEWLAEEWRNANGEPPRWTERELRLIQRNARLAYLNRQLLRRPVTLDEFDKEYPPDEPPAYEQLAAANQRIAELEGALEKCADSPFVHIDVADPRFACHCPSCIALAALSTHTEEKP